MVPVLGKFIKNRIKEVQSIGRPYPKAVLLIFKNTMDIIIAQARYIFWVAAINFYLITIIPVQSVHGSKPQKSAIANAQISHLFFTHINREQGLSSSSVETIFQDNLGRQVDKI